MNREEIRIKVPWGHIAAVTYGEKSNHAVLLLHGSFHNSGVFEELVTLLPTNFFYVAVDLPGHGQSSSFYEHQIMLYQNYFVALLHVMEHFGRERYTIIAHSMGATISTQFAQIYPEKIEKLFNIDYFYGIPNEPKDYLKMVRRAVDLTVKMDNKQTVYTYEEIIKFIQKRYYSNSVGSHIAEQVAKRIIKKIGDDQYILTVNDRRLIGTMFPCFSTEYLLKLLEERPIKPPCVVIKTKDLWNGADLFNAMLKVNPHIKVIEMNGGHFIVQENPKALVPHIEEFLLGSVHNL